MSSNISSQVCSIESGSEVQRRRVISGRAIVAGDLLVRGPDRRFCGSNRDSRMVCCLARPQDVSEQLHDILKVGG